MKISFSLLLATLGVASTTGQNVCAANDAALVTLMYQTASEDATLPPDGLITVTGFPDGDVHQVIFDVANTFPDTTIGEYFVEFHEQVVGYAYNNKCYADEEVKFAASLKPGTFTAVCTHGATPYALVSLYVTSETASDKVPTCCHAEGEIDSTSTVEVAAVQYMFKVSCGCPSDTPSPVTPPETPAPVTPPETPAPIPETPPPVIPATPTPTQSPAPSATPLKYCETPARPDAVSLSRGVCQNYATHSEAATTFAIDTTIQGGDVGIHPLKEPSITGIVHVVDGTISDGNEPFQVSVVAALDKYLTAEAVPNIIPANEIGGKTFTPGIYRSSSAINFVAGTTVTLDGQGQENPVFIFQAVSTLTTAKSTYFNMTNGARAENVLWAIGSSATIGASSILEGSILTKGSVTIGTHAAVHGCVLSQTAITFAGSGYIYFDGLGSNTPLALSDDSGSCSATAEPIDGANDKHSICRDYTSFARTTITSAGLAYKIRNDHIAVWPGTSITGLWDFTTSEGIETGNSAGREAYAHFFLATHFAAMKIRPEGKAMDIEIGSKTFMAGTHRSSSTINFAAGIVTLDGNSDNNAVFHFQGLTALTTGASTTFSLINGASAANVLWALGSAATLGATSEFAGTILAGTSITVGAGAIVEGCLLAEAAVTFAGDGSAGYANDGKDVLLEYLSETEISGIGQSTLCDCDCYPSVLEVPTVDSGYNYNAVCDNYAIHAQSTITFDGEGSTVIGGDIGVSPGTSITSAGILGFVDGVYASGNTAFQTSVVNAHKDMMDQKTGSGATQEIGGMTFEPGTYSFASTINIAHGTFVTLAGEGEYLFIAGSAMTTAAGTYVVLKDGAKAKDVVWALGTAATLGADSVLEGAILAGSAITFGTHAVLHGCALAQTAVTFESGGFVSAEASNVDVSLEYYRGDGTTSCGNPEPVAAPVDDATISQAAVCENDGQTYAVHARTTITFASDTPSEITNGDIGVSPGTSITEVVPVIFENGEKASGNSAFAAHAVSAHASAIEVKPLGRTLAIEIGGKTFIPGIYRSGSAINFAYGTTVTLDGLNQANPVWLFQAGSTLVTAANTSFILKNGAKAENVLWALGTAATLGADSVLEGSILAGTAITFGTNAQLNGCAIAQSAVTFETAGKVNLVNLAPAASSRALFRGVN
jgi:hypothetical protein